MKKNISINSNRALVYTTFTMSTDSSDQLKDSIITAVFNGNLEEVIKIIMCNPTLLTEIYNFSKLRFKGRRMEHGTLLHLLFRDPEYPEEYSDQAYDNLIPIADFLIYKGAKLNVLDSEGFSVLYRAIVSNHGDVIAFLIDKGADIEEERRGHTPLTFACTQNRIAPINFLLEKKANPNHLWDGKYSSLYYVCEVADFQDELVRLLLKSGANPQLGVSPLFAGESTSFKTLNCKSVEMMLAHGLNVNQTDNEGYSSLFALIKTKNAPVLRLLLDKVPALNVSCKNKDGQTPAQMVSQLLALVKLPSPPLVEMSPEDSLKWNQQYTKTKTFMEEWIAILQQLFK